MGYAMAMGVPLSLALASYEKEAKPRRIMYSITLLLIGANYFSMSRGPWLGLLFATIGMAVFCGKATRKKLLFLVVLTAAVCILRPGVRDSITNLCRGTFDPDSEKNSDYQYRWQLWGVAWDQIRLSPVRLLFGYGPDSAEGMDLSDYWHGEEGSTSSITKIGFTSWDNNYACDLIQLGILGFLTEIALHLSIVKTLLDNWRSSNPDNRILQGGIAVACLVFMFAMTNVFIFAPQLKYLFWALVAVGSNFSLVVANQETKEPALELNDSVEPAPRAASLAEGEATI
jgi:O-antigen ligase